MNKNKDLKIIIHFDRDFTRATADEIKEVVEKQWESGIMVFPPSVCRVVIIDRDGKAKYEWTRPKEVIIDLSPEENGKKYWFPRLFL